MCYCSNTGVEQILKSESAQKVDPGEEKSPAAPAGIQTHDLLTAHTHTHTLIHVNSDRMFDFSPVTCVHTH